MTNEQIYKAALQKIMQYIRSTSPQGVGGNMIYTICRIALGDE